MIRLLLAFPVISAVAVVTLVALMTWPVARYGFIEMGWVRAAFWGARVSLFPWRKDRDGGAAFCGAWALHRQPRPRPAEQEWLRHHLDQMKLTGATLGAHGLLAASRGNDVEARALLTAVRWFDPRATDEILRRQAIDWLVADAATRGDWAAVDTAADDAAASQAARVLQALARRHLGHPRAVTHAEAQALRDMLPLHQQPPVELLQANTAQPAEPSEGHDPVAAALLAQLALEAAPSPERLAITTDRWEHALAQLESSLTVRAAELGMPHPERAVVALRTQVERALVDLADAHQLPLHAFGAGDVGAAARHRRRDDALSAIELAAQALQRRIASERWLAPLDEAREWLALGALYEEGVRIGGDALRQVSFRTVYEPLCSLSVNLHNERGEHPLSNAITRWLLLHARQARDTAAVELQTCNLQV